MFPFELWVFPQNRHPGHNPAIDEDVNANDGDNNTYLSPMHKFTVGKTPIEGDEGDVEPIDDDAHDGEYGCDLHEANLPLSAPDDKEKTR